MALNKEESHVVALAKKTRIELKTLLLEKIPDNLQKQIMAVDVRDTFEAVIDSTVNLIEENLDLRAYASHKFTLADCTLSSGVYTYTLAHAAVNPDDDSELTVEGIACDYGTEYHISGTALTFSLDSSITSTTDLEFTVKYRYFL